MTLTKFLLERIAEDEAVAKAAASDFPKTAGVWTQDGYTITAGHDLDEVVDYVYGEHCWAHIARHDPARILAECEAKRQIVGAMGDDWVTHTLALPYADHPDYRPEWRP